MSLMILTPALCFRCTTSYVHLLVVMIQITFLSNCFTLVAPCLGFGISSDTECNWCFLVRVGYTGCIGDVVTGSHTPYGKVFPE